MATKRGNYYKTIQVYKDLIKSKDKEGKDSLRLKKRLLTIMVNGKNKSTHKV